MSWSSIGSVGTAVSSANNQASLGFSALVAPRVGDVLVLLLAIDNAVTADGADDAISSIADSASNTWKRAGSLANAQGAAQAGATIDVWYCQVANLYTVGVAVTLNFTNTTLRDASAATMWQFRPSAKSGVQVVGTATLANDGADPGSLNFTTPDAEYLRVRAIATESNSANTLTATNGWTAFTEARSGTGTSATEIGVRGEFHISSGIGDASDPALISADHASLYVVFREVPYSMADLLLRPDDEIADALSVLTLENNPLLTNKTARERLTIINRALSSPFGLTQIKRMFETYLMTKLIAAGKR